MTPRSSDAHSASSFTTAMLDLLGNAIARMEPGSDALEWLYCPPHSLFARAEVTHCLTWGELKAHLTPADQSELTRWLAEPNTPTPCPIYLMDPANATEHRVHLMLLEENGQRAVLFRDLQTESLDIHRDAEARRLATMETMAAGIAHEFNNHMTPVRGYVELALDELGHDHPVSNDLTTVLDRVSHCAELVGLLQQYGRKAVLHRREANLGHLLHSLLHVGLSMFGDPKHPVELQEFIEEDLPPVAVDHGRFREVIYHLLKNALAVMPQEGVLQGWAEAVSSDALSSSRGTKPTDFIRIRLVDNGSGMDHDTASRVFDPFFTTANRTERLGLGLSMAQGVVAQHGGWIELHSIPGSGTDVRMFFPVIGSGSAASTAYTEGDDDALPVLPAAPLGRLLVADDDAYVRQLVSRIFGNEGWLIDESVSHEETLQLATRQPDYYQVIILDITMPGPPVGQVVTKLRKKCPDSYVILMSGVEQGEAIEQVENGGAHAFIAKPFSPKKLLHLVDETVALDR